jgi:hypothetical protein
MLQKPTRGQNIKAFFRCVRMLPKLNFVSLQPALQSVVAPLLPGATEMQGAVLNNSALTSLLLILANNAAPFGLPMAQISVANAAGQTLNAATLGGASSVGALINRSGAAAVSDTTDTANNIVAGWPGAYVGATAQLIIQNANTGLLTLVAGTNVNLVGTTTVPTTNAARWYQWKVTNLANPNAPGAAATNTTTTTAAVVAAASGAAGLVIPVAAATGIIVGSALSWTDTKGVAQAGIVSAVSGLNITVGNAGTNGIANAATISVWNNVVSLTGLMATTTTIMTA